MKVVGVMLIVWPVVLVLMFVALILPKGELLGLVFFVVLIVLIGVSMYQGLEILDKIERKERNKREGRE